MKTSRDPSRCSLRHRPLWWLLLAAAMLHLPPFPAAGDDALLDLRALNERESGQTGFARLSPGGDGFVRGDGRPLRFWAVGSEIYKRAPDEMDRHCRFLAKLGVNMVRLHTTVAKTSEGAEITGVIDGIWRFLKAAKENGIYVTISPYYGHHKTPASWGLEGYAPDQMPWVAILQIHNEDSLFFWTMQQVPEPQARRLAQRFAAWLIRKHGSLGQALAAWSGHREAAATLLAPCS